MIKEREGGPKESTGREAEGGGDSHGMRETGRMGKRGEERESIEAERWGRRILSPVKGGKK